MKEVSIRFFLSCCFILVCGYGQMQALAGPWRVSPLWTWQPSDALPACVDDEHNDETWRLAYSANGERAFDCKIDVAELKEGEEDEHESLFQGRLSHGGNSTSIFFAHASYFQIGYENSGAPHASFSIASRRYLMLRVFRI